MMLLVAGSVFSQTATSESRAAAARLIKVLRFVEQYENAIKQAEGMLATRLDEMDLPEAEKANMRQNSSLAPFLEKFPLGKRTSMLIDIYAEVFTVEELEEVIAFYESPTGQNFLDKKSKVDQLMKQKVMAQVMPELQKEMADSIQKARQLKSDMTKKRNIAAVEKAKGILTLPAGVLNGAMGADMSTDFSSGEGFSNLLVALKISDLSELAVDGEAIHIGDMKTKASY